MSEITLTDEQLAFTDACAAGLHVVGEAAAGSGKTSTTKAAARRMRRKGGRLVRGRYLAYNSAAAKEARRSFPDHVRCSTIHSLAWSVGGPYADRKRVPLPGEGGAPRQPGARVAEILRIRSGLGLGSDLMLTPAQLGRITIDTLDRWCEGIDPQITTHHVPTQQGLTELTQTALGEVIVPLAQRAWDDVCDLERGQLNVAHDYYLRMWWNSGAAVIDGEYLILDEAQDANPLAAAIVLAQTGMQLIAVGDRYQSLYPWRGAVNAMANWPADVWLQLTQSFRFGPAVAAEANKWLALLGAQLRVRGTPSLRSVVGPLAAPRAILCRTNAGAMAQALSALDAGRKPALAKGGGAIKSFATAAAMLQNGRRVQHPDLFAFPTWADVQDYVDSDPGAGDLKVLVRLVDDWGAEVLISAVDRMVPNHRADVTLSTGHGAKGLEWPTVRVHDDFSSPGRDRDGALRALPQELGMLIYVAVTRGQLGLDPSGVAWGDEWLAEFLPHSPTVADMAFTRRTGRR